MKVSNCDSIHMGEIKRFCLLPTTHCVVRQGNTYIVVILPPQVDSIHVHPPIISPVVRQRDDQFHADFRRRVDDFVETRHVDRRLAVLPALENDFRGSRPFAAVLWQTSRVVSGVFVVEAPCAEDFEAGFLCGG